MTTSEVERPAHLLEVHGAEILTRCEQKDSRRAAAPDGFSPYVLLMDAAMGKLPSEVADQLVNRIHTREYRATDLLQDAIVMRECCEDTFQNIPGLPPQSLLALIGEITRNILSMVDHAL